MTQIASLAGSKTNELADLALKITARIWFFVAVIGQWIFGSYVLALYGRSAVGGNLEAWNQAMPHGYVAGDTMGNLAIGIHLFLAVLILFGGPLQFVPRIRVQWPRFHHWNGRLYMLAVLLASLAGLYMVWTRGAAGGFIQHVGISFDAVLIIVFGAIALWRAINRNIDAHRRWIFRLFMAVSAVWFFRVGLMFWIFSNGGPAGFDPETFEGPFLSFLTFSQYLVPLFFLEIYFYVQDNAGAIGRFLMASCLLVLTVAMSIGIFVATFGMWLPYF
ncbi:MAG: DUF2306 domain-containing protein [Rhodothermales bacterium]